MPSSVSCAQVVVVDVDRGATGRAKRVDGIGEALDAVVANDVTFTGDLDAASILDALGSRPGRGALDHVVRDEVILGLASRVARRVEAEFDLGDMASPDDDPCRVVEGQTVKAVADREALEPDVVDTGCLDGMGRMLGRAALAVDDGGAVAGGRPHDRFLGSSTMPEDPRAGVGPGVEQVHLARHRSRVGGRQAPVRIRRGAAAASRPRHDVPAPRAGGDPRFRPRLEHSTIGSRPAWPGSGFLPDSSRAA